jgi:hypothetical protein
MRGIDIVQYQCLMDYLIDAFETPRRRGSSMPLVLDYFRVLPDVEKSPADHHSRNCKPTRTWSPDFQTWDPLFLFSTTAQPGSPESRHHGFAPSAYPGARTTHAPRPGVRARNAILAHERFFLPHDRRLFPPPPAESHTEPGDGAGVSYYGTCVYVT